MSACSCLILCCCCYCLSFPHGYLMFLLVARSSMLCDVAAFSPSRSCSRPADPGGASSRRWRRRRQSSLLLPRGSSQTRDDGRDSSCRAFTPLTQHWAVPRSGPCVAPRARLCAPCRWFSGRFIGFIGCIHCCHTLTPSSTCSTALFLFLFFKASLLILSARALHWYAFGSRVHRFKPINPL